MEKEEEDGGGGGRWREAETWSSEKNLRKEPLAALKWLKSGQSGGFLNASCCVTIAHSKKREGL